MNNFSFKYTRVVVFFYLNVYMRKLLEIITLTGVFAFLFAKFANSNQKLDLPHLPRVESVTSMMFSGTHTD